MTFNDLQPSMLYFTSLIGSIVSPLILNQYSFTVYKGVIWWEKMVPSTRKRMESSKMAENTLMAHLHIEQPNNEANSVLKIEDIKSHSAPSSAEPCGPYADPDSCVVTSLATMVTSSPYHTSGSSVLTVDLTALQSLMSSCLCLCVSYAVYWVPHQQQICLSPITLD